MKNFILLILLSFSIPSLSDAQNRFGMSFGAGVSTIDNYHNYLKSSFPGTYDYLPAENYFSPTFAWNTGFFASHSISDKFDVEMELLLNAIGAYYSFPHTDSSSTIQGKNWRYVYLSIPINFRFNATKRFLIAAGPMTSILLKNLDKQIYYGDSRSIDFGANIAIGFTISEKFDLEVQAYHGLIRRNKDRFDSFIDKRLFNSSLTVALKYELWKGK